MGDWIVLALAATTLALPLLILLRRRQRAIAARAAARDWPSVTGRITTSMTNPVPRSGSLVSGNCVANVWYEYSLNGVRFSNNVVDLGDLILRKNIPTLYLFCKVQPDDAMKRFPEGREVPVYYDPANPKNSCLER